MNTLADFGNYMFKSVVMIKTKENTGSGFLLAVNVSETGIMPFIVTSKSLIKEKIQVVFQFINDEDKIELGAIETEAENWNVSESYDIAILPCGQIMNASNMTKNKIVNTPLIDKTILSNEEEQQIGLIEETFSIGYIDSINNNENCWPMSYVAYTASPIFQDFDKKPYFVINSKQLEGILGSPVFARKFYKGTWGYRLVGMWMDQTDTKENVKYGGNFTVILKVKVILDFIKSIQEKITKKSISQKE